MTVTTTLPLTPAAPARSVRAWPSPTAARPTTGAPIRPYSQGTLALSFPLPSGLDCQPRSSALTLVQPGQPTAAALDDSAAWAARFLQAVVEVVSSDRPLTQLVRWTDQDVYADIARRRQRIAGRTDRGPRTARPHVATVRVYHPTDSTAEISARVATGSRSRAIAARLDRHRERWLCTAIQFG